MNIKKAAILIIVIVVALFYASPYITLYMLKNAADKKDTQKLEAYIDFPAIKKDFKEKMRSIISGGLEYNAKENNSSSSAIGELGQAIANALVEPLVNNLVTPEIVAGILRGEKPQNGMNDVHTKLETNSEIQLTASPNENEKKKRKVKIIPAYEGFNAFRIRVTDLHDADSEVIFLMKRDGILGWKIHKAIIPALDKIANNINKKLSAINGTEQVSTPEFVPTVPEKTNEEEAKPVGVNPTQEPFTQPSTSTDTQTQP